MTSQEILILEEEEVRSLISPPQALEAVRDVFARLASGKAVQPASLDLEVDEVGDMHVKGAYVSGIPFFAVKAASTFYANEARGLPSSSGLSLVFDSSTGFIRAVLFDNGYLTKLRTGSAGALAAELLAKPDIEKAAIIGSGSQARYQLESLLLVRAPRNTVVWNRTTQKAREFVEEMSAKHEIEVTVADSCEEAVKGSDLVITTTSSRSPLIGADWVDPGTHLTAMGSDFAEKQELDVGVLGKADRVVADTLANCMRSGEVRHAVEAGVIDVEKVEELGDIVIGKRPGRQSQNEITIADQCGLGIEDTAVANFVVSHAIKQGVGNKVSAGKSGARV